MTYLGRDGYKATAEEMAALPDYHEAFRRFRYQIPVGQYRTVSASTHGVAVIDVIPDQLSKHNREVFSQVEIVQEAHGCNQDNGTSCEECRMPACDHGDDENCRHCCGADTRTSRQRELEAM